MNSWRVTAAAVQGTSHVKQSVPCQDAVEWAVLENGWLAVAVADGAGSARESGHGASVACRSVIDYLKQNAPGEIKDGVDLLRRAVGAARIAIEKEAAAKEIALRELACTIIVAVASPDGAVAAQIGDGAALVRTGDGKLEALTTPAPSEYLNETIFLTGDEALTAMQTKSFTGKVAGLALFSDGLQMLALKMPEGRPHEPFFEPLFRYLLSEVNDRAREEQFKKLLASPRIQQRADDDLTLLLATRV